MSPTSPLSRRGIALVAAVALLAGTVLVGTAGADATRRDRHGPKPTIVLVHGAFADASGWNGVIDRLHRQGYPVLAPANPLRGVASDAAST